MGTLSGKNAFITGTSQGIGAATAKALIEAGCNICMHYFHSGDVPFQLQKMAEARNQKAQCVKADLTKDEEAVKCVKTAVESFGVFNVLVNNSGSLVGRRYLSEVDMDFWQTSVDLNLKTMILITRELLPYLDKKVGSSIVNLSSLAGRTGGHPGSLVYSATKGAILTWTRALSKELGPSGIRVNAVAPGFIEGTSFHSTHTTRESAIKTIQGIPLGRSGNPEDIARAIVFLASEYDGFINGATLDINGGVYCA